LGLHLWIGDYRATANGNVTGEARKKCTEKSKPNELGSNINILHAL